MTVDITNRTTSEGEADTAGSPTIDVIVPDGVEADDCVVIWAVGAYNDVQIGSELANVEMSGAGIDPDQVLVASDFTFNVGPAEAGIVCGLYVVTGVTAGGTVTIQCLTNPDDTPVVWSVSLLVLKGADPDSLVFDDNDGTINFGTPADPSVCTTPEPPSLTIERPPQDGGLFLYFIGATYTDDVALAAMLPAGFTFANCEGTVAGMDSNTRTAIGFRAADANVGPLVSGGVSKDAAFAFTPRAAATCISLNPKRRHGPIFIGTDGATRNGPGL